MYDFLRVTWAATTNANRESLKSPVGLMVTVLSPAIMIMLFAGAYGAQGMVAALPGLCAYAVMNACVIQVSGAVAIDRQFPWDAYLRTLPGSWLARLLGKAMSCFLFALLALVPVVLLVGWPLGEQLLVLAPRLLFGAVLTAVLGIGIGLMLGFVGDPNAVGAISSLIFLLLAAAGGMFTLSDAAGTTPPILPTAVASALVRSIVSGQIPAPGVLGAWLVQATAFYGIGALLLSRIRRRGA